MTNYKKIYVSNIDNKIIDEIYKGLLENKSHFVILDVNYHYGYRLNQQHFY